MSTTQATAATEQPITILTRDELLQAWQTIRVWLQRERGSSDHWTGRLSTSALSTATAVSALVLMSREGAISTEASLAVAEAIEMGSQWLAKSQNKDGGFGDTDLSHSNIATTLLVLAAWQLKGVDASIARQYDAASKYVDRVGRWDALRRRYGRDKTFVAPILTNCALAGLISWDEVPTLPFEAAWLPQACYRLAQMPVVSYAIPALVAIGQSKFYFRPPANPVLRYIRQLAQEPTLQVLARMQPASGGYLEAVPLTSFVLMNLAAIKKSHLPVAKLCLEFLMSSRLSDGSWPIDTNLATWVTTLAANAEFRGPLDSQCIAGKAPKLVNDQTIEWLLSCQHLQKHPFTGAKPGGWGWTDLSGAVPDADDTPGALLVLANWYSQNRSSDSALTQRVLKAAVLGMRWLIELQNRDGGWPTFCRGWGTLPFDRSGTDLTAHAIRALDAWKIWRQDLRSQSRKAPSIRSLESAINKGLKYLARHQQPDGSWIPLWFGNQDQGNELNRAYGTSRVLLAYAALGQVESAEAKRAIAFLESNQNADGGWGGGSSVPYQNESALNYDLHSSFEETAVVVEALCLCGSKARKSPAIMRGLKWLAAGIGRETLNTSWPIGFYFAKLWYYERMYPAVFGLAAIGAGLRAWEAQTLSEHSD